MASGEKQHLKAVECAGRAGKYAFGLDESKAVQLLRKLADELEAGEVALYSVSTACHTAHEEFTVQELVIEFLQEIPPAPAVKQPGPRIIKD
jgi:hypothetical protein